MRRYSKHTIGNRTGAKHGGDAAGTSLRSETYVADGLDRYTSRSAVGGRFADILGLAAAGSSVTVNGTSAWRRGEYFRAELGVGGNTTVWQNVDITTSGGGGVTGKKLYVPPMLETYTYDGDGNLTGDGRWTYTWDAENRLVRMETSATAYGAGVPRQLLQFDHDDQGRRIWKRVSNWNGTAYVPASDVRFALDGWNVVAELDGLSGNALLRSYLWGFDLSGTLDGAGGVGGLIAMRPAGGNAQFAAYDGNGNVIGLVDGTSGATAANYEYGPFGEPLRLTGTQAAANPFRFSTKATEPESGLVYYGYRYYNPATGRWINRDPSEEDGGVSLNGFVGNHPQNATDPNGLYEIDFHYYVIAYLFRAQGYYGALADSIAFNSQHVDDDPATDPLLLGLKGGGGNNGYTHMLAAYHFPGSTKSTPTRRAEDSALTSAQNSLGSWSGGENGDAVMTGINLHTLADTYSHDGFTAYRDYSINGLQNHPEWKHYNSPFFVGHGAFGSRPDYPFERPAVALFAARLIYDMIPSRQKCDVLPWESIEADLSSLFSNRGNERQRAEAVLTMIIRRFKESYPSRYSGTHEFREKIMNKPYQIVRKVWFKLFMGMCGLVFSGATYFAAESLSGAGHGVYTTCTLIGAPYWIFYFIWPVIFFTSSFKLKWCRFMVRIVSAAQIAFALYDVIKNEDVVHDVSKAFGDSVGGVLFGGSIVAYVAAHACLWMMTAQRAEVAHNAK